MQEIFAGILCLHKDSKRILLGLRSDSKEWSIFGGHFKDSDIVIKNTATREFNEETLCQTPYKISNEPIYIFKNNFLRYYTFLTIFEEMFEPKIEKEHLEYSWFKLDCLPDNILLECKEMLDKNKSLLNNICNINRR